MALSGLGSFKPAASARGHLLVAALMWSVVGTILLVSGVVWIQAGFGAYGLILALLCVGLGQLKARFALRPAAARTIARIEARGDGRCIGGFLSVPTWGFVLLMMLVGYWLRHGLMPRAIVGLVYVTIGAALVSASRQLWGAWHRHGQAS